MRLNDFINDESKLNDLHFKKKKLEKKARIYLF
jgi:hypothetical protein